MKELLMLQRVSAHNCRYSMLQYHFDRNFSLVKVSDATEKWLLETPEHLQSSHIAMA